MKTAGWRTSATVPRSAFSTTWRNAHSSFSFGRSCRRSGQRSIWFCSALDLGGKAMNDETKSRVDKFERRQLLKGTAAAIGAVALPLRAKAQGKYSGQKVVFASWGGVYQDASKKGYCDSFAAKTGATVIQDGPVDYAKLRTMIPGGSPTWDVVDVTIDLLFNCAKDNLFEHIDT